MYIYIDLIYNVNHHYRTLKWVEKEGKQKPGIGDEGRCKV